MMKTPLPTSKTVEKGKGLEAQLAVTLGMARPNVKLVIPLCFALPILLTKRSVNCLDKGLPPTRTTCAPGGIPSSAACEPGLGIAFVVSGANLVSPALLVEEDTQRFGQVYSEVRQPLQQCEAVLGGSCGFLGSGPLGAGALRVGLVPALRHERPAVRRDALPGGCRRTKDHPGRQRCLLQASLHVCFTQALHVLARDRDQSASYGNALLLRSPPRKAYGEDLGRVVPFDSEAEGPPLEYGFEGRQHEA
mmetsp:Transcript_12630/g.40675  ORF Transcript_12630/g.40675 Transcript_12630/m.40675 type:complete len:249 (+) Transcript_12630:274-1020(+)